MPERAPIRVMIVDDSNFMRKALAKLVTKDPVIEVVGLMPGGEEALARLLDLRPDVITLDVEMAGMDGLATLRAIMKLSPTPVIMFSAHTRGGARVTLMSLKEGAVDFMQKPSGSLSMDLDSVSSELVEKIKIASRVRVSTAITARTLTTRRRRYKAFSLPEPAKSIVAVGSSTGGVQALHRIVSVLSPDINFPMLIVQHMPPLFTRSLAESLDADSSVKVKEAESGELVVPATVYIAAGGYHMKVRKDPDGVRIRLERTPLDMQFMPSVNVLFSSVAEVYGRNSLGVILSGMGDDGTEGLSEIKAAGGFGIVQNEATCAVYGMSRSVVEAGLADLVLPVDEITPHIVRSISRHRKARSRPRA